MSLPLIKSTLLRIEHWLLPSVCVFCHSLRVHARDGDQAPLCAACRADLPRIASPCPRCALPRDGDAPICSGCREREPPVAGVRAAFRYAFPIDVAIRAVKFAKRLEYLPVLAAGMRPLVPVDRDLIVPVPLARRRQARRGFNQAAELARCLGSSLSVADNVRRTRHTPPQTGLDAGARQSNVRGAFAVRGELAGRYPLIVDDVMTTGATVFELARCLRRHGAERVAVLVAARRAMVAAGGVAST